MMLLRLSVASILIVQCLGIPDYREISGKSSEAEVTEPQYIDTFLHLTNYDFLIQLLNS